MRLRGHLGTGWCQEPDWKMSGSFGGGLDFTRGMSPATTTHTQFWKHCIVMLDV